MNKKIFHTEAVKKWNTYSIHFQMANIGAEVGRVVSWKKKENQEHMKNALYRALELIDFTVKDPKNFHRMGEILRVREVLCDFGFRG